LLIVGFRKLFLFTKSVSQNISACALKLWFVGVNFSNNKPILKIILYPIIFIQLLKINNQRPMQEAVVNWLG